MTPLEQRREEQDGGATTSSYAGDRRFADLTFDWRNDTIGVVAGVEMQREEVAIDQGFATVFADQAQHGAFVTAQSGLGAVTLTGAVRVDDFEGFGAETTWRAGASVNLSDAIRIYGAYGTSFRAPTLYERFIYFGDPNLDPERGSTWELGADARFAQDNGLEVSFVYRNSKIEDLINFDSSFFYANIDEAEIESAEIRFEARPAGWLIARLGYVFTDARDVVAATPLLRRPEHAWSASLDAEHGAFSAQLAWRQIGARADQIYGDDGFWLGVGETPSYDLWRASAAWAFSPAVQIYLAAENFTGEAYEPANGFAGAPQSVLIGVRLRPQS